MKYHQVIVFIASTMLAFSSGVWAAEEGQTKPIESPNTQQVASLSLKLESVSSEQPAIRLNLGAKQPDASYLILTRNQQEIETIALQAESDLSAVSVDLQIPTEEPSIIEARAYSSDKQMVARSAQLTVDPARFRPSEMVVGLSQNRVVNGRLDHVLVAPLDEVLPRQDSEWMADMPRPRTTLNVYIDDKQVTQQTVAAHAFSILPSIQVPKGKHTLQLVAENAWGMYRSEPYQVVNLGVNVPSESFVLVDKNSFSLYHIEGYSLKGIYPVAIGTPRTPTPTGYFMIGRKEKMSNPHTSWGVIRMLLYRKELFNKHWSGYAIHGTNRPPSIGTEASHGCLRMFNKDVTYLASILPEGTMVLIKDKLEVYIDKI